MWYHRLRGNVSLSRTLIFPLLFFLGTAAYSEPYRPYPVVFVHGLNGSSYHWGVMYPCDATSTGVRGNDVTRAKYGCAMENHMIMPFLDLMKPYFIPIRVGNLPDTLTYLAAISLDDPSGSIDPGPYNTSATIKYHFSRIVNGDTIPDSISVTLRDRGAGYELQHFIKQVLFTYYDTTWNLNPDAKVVLVAHSMGGVVIAEALRQDPSLKQHIHNVITLGAPVKDLYISHPRYKPILVSAMHWNPALLLARPLISAMYSGLASSQLFSCFSAIAIAQGLQRLLHSSSLTDVLITVINGAIMLRSPDIRQLICSGNEQLISIGIATGLKEFMGGFAHGWLDFQQSIGRYLDIFGDLLYVLHLQQTSTQKGNSSSSTHLCEVGA